MDQWTTVWWFFALPLWKIMESVSCDDEFPNLWKFIKTYKNHVPKHQPDNYHFPRKKNILGIYPIFKHTLISFWGRKPEFPMSEIRHAIYPANVCLPSFIVKSPPHNKIVGWNSKILNPFMFSDYKTNCETIWFDKRSSLKTCKTQYHFGQSEMSWTTYSLHIDWQKGTMTSPGQS